MTGVEPAPRYTYDSDYGPVPVVVLEVDGDSALTVLAEDTPPLGDQGDPSWVPVDLLEPPA